MSAFTLAAQMLGDMPLSAGQLAQLRAIDMKYQQRLFTLVNPIEADADATGSPVRAPRVPTDVELRALEEMVTSDVIAMLTQEQRHVLHHR